MVLEMQIYAAPMLSSYALPNFDHRFIIYLSLLHLTFDFWFTILGKIFKIFKVSQLLVNKFAFMVNITNQSKRG